MRRNLLIVSFAACCALIVSSSVAMAADNWVGTWKMDAAKSKFSPGPAPKSLTLKWEATAAGTKFSSEGVGADGKASHTAYVSKYDGKDVAYEGNPDADMAAPMKVDDNTYTNTWKKAGKPTIMAKVVVSKDGKTMTITQTGTNSKGEAVNNTVMYTKQ
ncbi:MAG TPA: hypothetical protein VGO79_13410 [Thermoanaerobaculia bacterium]